MSAYVNDPRVTHFDSGACDVHPDMGVRAAAEGVWYAFPYGINEAPHAEPYPTADEAIRSLIGDPR